MENNYSVSKTGIIFKMENDGCVTEIGKIGSNGKIEGSKSTNKTVYIFLIVFFITTTIIGIVQCSSAENDASNYRNDKSALKNKNSSLESEISELESKLQKKQELIKEIGDMYPIIVNKMEVSGQDFNSETWSTGTFFYASSTQYVRTKINFYGIKEGTIALKIKLIDPSGTLYRIDKSPSDCTAQDDVSITYLESEYYVSGGFGYVTSLGWHSGNWRYEIWYGNTILSSKSFYISSL